MRCCRFHRWDGSDLLTYCKYTTTFISSSTSVNWCTWTCRWMSCSIHHHIAQLVPQFRHTDTTASPHLYRLCRCHRFLFLYFLHNRFNDAHWWLATRITRPKKFGKICPLQIQTSVYMKSLSGCIYTLDPLRQTRTAWSRIRSDSSHVQTELVVNM